jgi:hypothetical protein
LHEESHLDQWAERGCSWGDETLSKSFHALWQWTNHKQDVPPNELEFLTVFDLERDCDRRVIRKIKNHWSDFADPYEYAQYANAILFDYVFALQHRRF